MQNAEDRRRLMGQYSNDEPRPLAAVLKCAAGIAILFAVAAGPWIVLTGDTGGSSAEPSRQKAAAAFPNSIEQSRRVFEERRQQAQGRESTKAALAK